MHAVPATVPHPRALLIDAMGTLVTLEPPAPLLVGSLAQRCGISVSEAEAAAALRAEIGFYRAHMDEGRDAASVAALHDRCAAVLAGALPGSAALSAASPAAIREALLGSLRFVAFPDAAPALARAQAAGLRVVVVSNWDASLPDVLRRVGLAALIDGVAVSAVVGARKPAPEIFAAALALAGVDAADALHVGDTPHEDVAGARAYGIAAVLVDRDGGAGRAGEGGPGAAASVEGAPVVGAPVVASLDALRWT